MAWHATRIFAYTGLNLAFAGIIVTSYATSSAAANMFMDERLKDVNLAIKHQVRSKRGLPQAPTEQHRGTTQPSQDSQSSQDDASPTNGLYQDRGAEVETGSRGWRKSQSSRPLEEIHESQDGGLAVYDDASPTGGQGIGADTTPQQTSGSAWERLRRGEAPAQNKQTRVDEPERTTQQQPESAWSRLRRGSQQGQQESSSTDDSYSYSDTNESKESARALAQREFDEQVERERRGGDFSSSGGDQKRW